MEKVIKFIQLYILLIACALLNGCGGGGSEPSNDGSNNSNEPPAQAFEELSLFPIAPQYKWLQNFNDNSPTTVGSPLTIKGRTVYPLNFDFFDDKEYFSTTKNELSYFGIFVPVVGEPGNYFTADVKFDSPVLLFSRDWKPGYTSTFERNTSINIQPRIGMRTGSAIGKVTYYGHVFTGENYIARDTHHIRYELQLDATINGDLHRVNYDIHLWLVEGIGIVKRRENGFESELSSTEGLPNRLYFSAPQGSKIPPRAQEVANYQTRQFVDFRDREPEITYTESTDWLNSFPSGGWNEPYLQPNTTDLPIGEHRAQLTFDGDTSGPLSMEIIYNIVPPNHPGSTSVDFNLSPTFTLEDLHQTVSLDADISPLLNYGGGGLITINDVSTSESGTSFSIELDLNTLLKHYFGTVYGTLRLAYDSESEAFFTVPFNIQLPELGQLQIPEMTFNSISESTELPDPLPINYLGEPLVDLNYSTWSIAYRGTDDNWLAVEHDAQSTQLLVSITRSDLPPGDYLAEVTISGSAYGYLGKVVIRNHVEAP